MHDLRVYLVFEGCRDVALSIVGQTPGKTIMSITLKDAILAAQTDLWDLARIGIKLRRPLGMVSGVLSSLPDGGDAPILLAKDACEAITDIAREAADAGRIELAERLRCIVRMLSPVVARSYQELQ